MELPQHLLDFVDGQSAETDNGNNTDGNDNDWRLSNESEDAMRSLVQKKYAPNTAKKICYVIHLWKDWVSIFIYLFIVFINFSQYLRVH